jgi:hypothetical protein
MSSLACGIRIDAEKYIASRGVIVDSKILLCGTYAQCFTPNISITRSNGFKQQLGESYTCAKNDDVAA